MAESISPSETLQILVFSFLFYFMSFHPFTKYKKNRKRAEKNSEIVDENPVTFLAINPIKNEI